MFSENLAKKVEEPLLQNMKTKRKFSNTTTKIHLYPLSKNLGSWSLNPRSRLLQLDKNDKIPTEYSDIRAVCSFRKFRQLGEKISTPVEEFSGPRIFPPEKYFTVLVTGFHHRFAPRDSVNDQS